MAKTLEARRWFVSGIVQGVGYRYFARHHAQRLDLSGWAKNLADGRVEVFAVGSLEALSELAGALHMGPPMSQVRTVEQLEAAIEKCFDFEVR